MAIFPIAPFFHRGFVYHYCYYGPWDGVMSYFYMTIPYEPSLICSYAAHINELGNAGFV